MREEDDIKRRKFVWVNESGEYNHFFLDDYNYKCLQENIIAANIALKTGIAYKYGRNGWTALLIYYANALLEIYWENLDALAYVIDQQVLFECEQLGLVHTHLKNNEIRYDLGWGDKQILKSIISIATMLQWILKNIYNINNYTEEDADYQQEYYQAEEDTVEEDVCF